ncbi:MAG: endonuclease/exonuclease/phosphatase family protein [Solirubrobacterales bacterium]
MTAACRLAPILAWAVATGFAIWAVVRWLGLEAGYPLVPLLAFTPYVAALAALAAVALVALRRFGPGALTAVAAALLIGLVLPRAVGDGERGEASLRVMTANMKLGEGDAQALTELVREHDVDVLAVQELTAPLAARLERAGLDHELHHSVLAPTSGSAGGGIWSVRPILEEVSDAPDSIAGSQPAVRVRTPEAHEVIVYSVHAPAPTGASPASKWAANLATIPPASLEGPVRIVAGDFNATLDHDALRDVIGRGYRDAAEAAGVGLEPTWPNGRLFPPQVTIDHVLVDERAAVAGADVLELPGSDHRAVLAEVLLLPPR